MQVQLSKIAEMTNGVLLGDSERTVDDAAPLHSANENAITFAEYPEKIDFTTATKARAAFVPLGFDAKIPNFSLIQVADVKASFKKIVAFFRPPRTDLVVGVSPSASIDPTAKIGKNVAIGPNAVVGADVELGDNVRIFPGVVLMPGVSVGDSTTIFPNAVVYENCVIGKNCLLHANCVVGAYGFGYDSSTGVHQLAAQFGNVVIEDDVEIGACATIDRGAYDATLIGAGTKIDNHVMIAHNCRLGKRNMICASADVAGSVTTGDYVVMAGRVGVRDHLKIGDGATLGAMAGVMADVPAGARIVGIPATPEKEQMRKQAALARLPEMRKELKALERQIAEIQRRLDAENEGENL